MTPEQKQEFEELQRQVRELLDWKREREQQALPFPLDTTSITIIQNI